MTNSAKFEDFASANGGEDLDSKTNDNKRGYLIDMDGVIYRGNKLIPGSDYFIQSLLEKEIPFLFLTNNSQRSRCDVVLKLANLGINVEIEHIFTCSISTARFLASQKTSGSAYVIGDAGLLTALHDHGYAINDTNPDYVVVGEGRLIKELFIKRFDHVDYFDQCPEAVRQVQALKKKSSRIGHVE